MNDAVLFAEGSPPSGCSFVDLAGAVPKLNPPDVPLVVGAVTGTGAGANVAPKLNRDGGAGTGVDVPELGSDFFPKKSGTAPDRASPLACFSPVGAASGADVGLPIPNPSVFLGPSTFPNKLDDVDGVLPNPPNNDAGGLPAGVVLPLVLNGKNPSAEGTVGTTVVDAVDLAGGGAVGGDSGSATIDPEAKGEDARGREAFRRESGPAGARDGTLSAPDCSILVGGAGPNRPNKPIPSKAGVVLASAAESFSFDAGDGKGAVAEPRPENVIPENDWKGILG